MIFRFICIFIAAGSIFLNNLSAQTQTETKEKELNAKDFDAINLEDLINMEVVTASKKVERIFDAPLDISVLSAQDIKRAGVTSIVEALRLMPGIIVREQTPGNFDIHIRGLDNIHSKTAAQYASNSITLVMINNRVAYNDFFGGTFWDLQKISVDDIERIEVVRGPAAAMYGPNAASGVIHFITKRPDAKRGFSASTYSQIGTQQTMLLNAAVGYNMDSVFAIRLSGNIEARNRYDNQYFSMTYQAPWLPVQTKYIRNEEISKRDIPNPEFSSRRASFNAHAVVNLTDFSLNAEGGFVSSEIQSVFTDNNVLITRDSSREVYGHLFGNWQQLYFTFDVTSGIRSPVRVDGGRFTDYSILNASAEYNIAIISNFSLRPGVSYRSFGYGSDDYFANRTYNRQTNSIEKTGDDKTNSVLSGFVRADYQSDRLRLIASIRADKFATPDNVFWGTQFVATYKTSEDVLLRVSYGSAIRSPFMINLFLSVASFEDNTLRYEFNANPNQKPLTVQTVEAGVRWHASSSLLFDATLFSTSAEHFDTFTPEKLVLPQPPARKPTLVSSVVNIDGVAQQLGASLSATANPAQNLQIQGFITVQNTKVSDLELYQLQPTGVAVTKQSYTHKATPDYYGGLVINYQPLPAFNLNVSMYAYGANTLSLSAGDPPIGGAVAMPVDGNVLTNICLNYEILKGIKLFANARNITGADKQQFGFADKIGTVFTVGAAVEF